MRDGQAGLGHPPWGGRGWPGNGSANFPELGDPQYRLQKTVGLIMRTPKKVPLVLGNLHIGLAEEHVQKGGKKSIPFRSRYLSNGSKNGASHLLEGPSSLIRIKVL